ncbi:response regulator transcription factor [Kordiimonas sp. SCSIO 12610]|uniref:response regulator transcription factor n=1 Tax=Kordiimonas sp. SCSIO 12610 TaxID=2829597 RepID=UPI00210E30D5|nr:response regulator transcription factor [Kordiimonas sp. SCSIO 12610]UTW55711.1 response regulator transcription factor [Kordiimonas sp. SCSIO 12610]
MRVLIIEDNLDMQANIADYLEKDFSLDFAYNGDQGLELALANEYDVIVLDLMLPGRDGLSVCNEYKKRATSLAPIIMLTARDTIEDKEAGFNVGADDYLVKPFSLRELKMRIGALARRPKERIQQSISYAGLVLEPDSLLLTRGLQKATLLEKEAKILRLLIEGAPDIVSTASINYALWGEEPPESGALRTHIYNLRKSLSSLDASDFLITHRGKGYSIREVKEI